MVPAKGLPVQRKPWPATFAMAEKRPPDVELWKALEISQAKEFVSEMSGELEGEIDQGGTNVSGGQRNAWRSPAPL